MRIKALQMLADNESSAKERCLEVLPCCISSCFPETANHLHYPLLCLNWSSSRSTLGVRRACAILSRAYPCALLVSETMVPRLWVSYVAQPWACRAGQPRVCGADAGVPR